MRRGRRLLLLEQQWYSKMRARIGYPGGLQKNSLLLWVSWSIYHIIKQPLVAHLNCTGFLGAMYVSS